MVQRNMDRENWPAPGENPRERGPEVVLGGSTLTDPDAKREFGRNASWSDARLANWVVWRILLSARSCDCNSPVVTGKISHPEKPKWLYRKALDLFLRAHSRSGHFHAPLLRYAARVRLCRSETNHERYQANRRGARIMMSP